MIKINKNNIYLSDFTNELEKYLDTKLKKIIKNKVILGKYTDVLPEDKENKVEYKYTKIDGKEKKQKIKFTINDEDIPCLEYLKKNIKEIVSFNIDKQKQFIEILKNRYPDITKKYEKNTCKPNIYNVVKHIFIDGGYESKISSANDGKIAYMLVDKISLGSCPYCNRNYISAITKKEEKGSKTRPQLDHFYPKAIYPFLACSFYNLIPSCASCNLMKSDQDSYTDMLISPYEIEKNIFKFSYDLNSVDVLNIGIQNSSKYDYKESINIVFDKKNKTNEKYFELEKLYNQEHRNVVIELLVKKAYYPQSYIKELSSFGFDKDEIYMYLFSNYNQDEDLHKRPLSKLIRDISEELGLIT